MGKSYRKPWGTFCSIKSSAASDKEVAARSMRRAQEQSLREALRDEDWDGWLIPERYECNHNDVWGWGRDGTQHPMTEDLKYLNNPFAYTSYSYYSLYDPKFHELWLDRLRRDEEFQKYLRRK